MGENSSIEWCYHTFNPWIGCTKVSAACDNCYAEVFDKRFTGGNRWGPHAARTRTSATNWRKPLKWNRDAEGALRRPRVFCASLADVFDNHRSITSGWHGDLWALINATPNLDWLLLTKRPQNIAKMLPETYGLPEWGGGWNNVWLGTTVEDQTEADRRIPQLLSVPAKARFLSCEPLLGHVNLLVTDHRGHDISSLRGIGVDPTNPDGPDEYYSTGRLNWVITGGESGPNFRHADPDWFRSLRDQCEAADVPFLFKQWGGNSTKEIKAKGRELDGVVHDGYPAPLYDNSQERT